MKAAALYFDKLYILDPIKASWNMIGPAALAIFAAPLTPAALAAAGLGLATGAVIPGAEWLIDWREGRETWKQNGLHYLLRI